MEQKTAVANAIQINNLGKRYGSFWALKDCTITVPQGSLSALVGPNGAGKTTLLKLLAGVNSPSAGNATVLGQTPSQSSAYLSQIGYLAQQIPLYNQMTVAKHLGMGAHIDTHWDNDMAVKRLQELKIPFDRPVGKLSGGQRAQVGLALALAKRPKLLLLDEPVAALDPLARSNFLTSLSHAVADANGELTVIMSSHLLADLEQICDYLIVLATGQTQLCGTIEDVLATHKQLIGPRINSTPQNSSFTVIKQSSSERETMLFVRLNNPSFHDPGWRVHDVDIEDIVLAYMDEGAQKGEER